MPLYEIGRITTYYETAYVEAATPEAAVEKGKKLDLESGGRDDIFGAPTTTTEYLLLTEDVEL